MLPDQMPDRVIRAGRGRPVGLAIAAAALLIVTGPAMGQIDPTGRGGGTPAKPPAGATPTPVGQDMSVMKPEGPQPEILGLTVPNPTRVDDLAPAVAALNRMVDAYRSAPALVDEIELIQFFSNRSRGVQRAAVALGEGTNAMVRAPNSRMMTVGDQFFYEEPERFPTRFVQVPLDTNLIVSASKALQSRPALAWHVRSRFGGTSEEIMHALSMGVPDPTTVAGFERAVLPDGTPVERITLNARSGWSVVTLDADTGLVRAIDADFKPPGTPVETFRVSIHVRSKARVLDTLPEPMAFEPETREPVADIGQLRGVTTISRRLDLTVKPGEAIPEFTGLSIDGAPFNIRDHRGRIQVLVFWNLQSTSFLRAPGRIRDLAQEVENRDGVPVDVWMVNSLDRTDEAEKWDEVFDYWRKERLTVTSLFDDTNEIAETLGVRQIPTTVVIDQYGRLVDAQGAMGPDWMPKVRALIERAALVPAPRADG